MRLWLLAKIILHPIQAVQDKIDQWVMARVKRQPGPITVPRTRVYILPTRFGYGFGFMTFIMLMAAMNYSNSMAFALTFLLAGLGLVAMHHTHGNMVNVRLLAGRAPPVFAGELAHFEIHIENPTAKPRYSLGLAWPLYSVANVEFDEHGRPLKGRRRRASETDAPVCGDVAAQSTRSLKLVLKTPRRGWLQGRVFSLGTEFPLGLFHAWTWAELELECLVYPRPAPPGREPSPDRGGYGVATGTRAGLDEFAGLRNYQHGDTARSIHWKSLPKLQNPMVKQFVETREREYWLDWYDLPDLDTEDRLSQLTRWVLDAHGASRHYGLRVPGLTLSPASGEDHRESCLRALALFQP